VGEGSVWLHVAGKVLRIDPRTAMVVATIPTHGSLGSIVFGTGAVWVLEQSHLWPNSENLLSRIDPSSNQVTKTIHIGSGAFSLAVGEGAVWIAQSEPGAQTVPTPYKLLRIEPQSLRIVRAIALWRRPGKIAIAAGSLWVSSLGGSLIMRVDPMANRVTEMIHLPGEGSFGSGLAVGGGALWVGQSIGLSSGRVYRIELSDFTTADSHQSQNENRAGSLKSADERENYLAMACKEDPELQREVESLLRAHHQAAAKAGPPILIDQQGSPADTISARLALNPTER
jgi:streptogramin lyase